MNAHHHQSITSNIPTTNHMPIVGGCAAWHEMDVDPHAFAQMLRGDKTKDVRFNDRDFKVGDGIIFKETSFTKHEHRQGCPLAYTGNEIRCVVNSVKRGYGMSYDWVILTFSKVSSIELSKDLVDSEYFPPLKAA